MLASLFDRLRARRELARLSDRMLRDIGVEPGEIRPPAGPSILVPQPALLRQLGDPAPMPPQPAPDRRGGRAQGERALWINMLRGPGVRPI